MSSIVLLGMGSGNTTAIRGWCRGADARCLHLQWRTPSLGIHEYKWITMFKTWLKWFSILIYYYQQSSGSSRYTIKIVENWIKFWRSNSWYIKSTLRYCIKITNIGFQFIEFFLNYFRDTQFETTVYPLNNKSFLSDLIAWYRRTKNKI